MLAGKKILISGLLSNRSIAFGIAKSCVESGADLALTYQDERFADRVMALSTELNARVAIKCNVDLENDIKDLPAMLKKNNWSTIDGYVHAIAYAPKDAISGDLTDGFSKENF